MSVSFEPHRISYNDFSERYLRENRPCILDGWSTSDWKSMKEWKADDKPDFKLLNELFGKEQVPVVFTDANNRYDDPKYVLKSFADYLSVWRSEESDGRSNELWYVKDWHFQLHHSSEQYYNVPIFCQSDFLNEFCDYRNRAENASAQASNEESKKHRPDDFRFLYAGLANTWTPLHFDVLNSFSWSTNVIGVKLWYLIEEGDEKLLPKGTADLRPLLPDRIDTSSLSSSFLLSEKLKRKDVADTMAIGRTHVVHGARIHELLQFEGEMIFVPSGWHHQVMNVTSALSINENWINAFNLDRVVAFFLRQYDTVVEELTKWQPLNAVENDNQANSDSLKRQAELLEAEEQRDIVLKADLGFNFDDLFSMLEMVLLRRRAALHKLCRGNVTETCTCETVQFVADDNSARIGHANCIKHLRFDDTRTSQALTSLCQAMQSRSPALFASRNYDQRLAEILSYSGS